MTSQGNSITEGIGNNHETGNIVGFAPDGLYHYQITDAEMLPVLFSLAQEEGLIRHLCGAGRDHSGSDDRDHPSHCRRRATASLAQAAWKPRRVGRLPAWPMALEQIQLQRQRGGTEIFCQAIDLDPTFAGGYWGLAAAHLARRQWKSARTTNASGRLHEEFKRRIKTQTVLPSREIFSADCVVGRKTPTQPKPSPAERGLPARGGAAAELPAYP
jgi:hypothetical protein